MLGGIFGGGKVSAEARHILVDSEKLCKELKQKINKGASFEDLAKEHSKCPSGKGGGKLGKFKPGQMVKEFDNVCFDPKVKIGKVQG